MKIWSKIMFFFKKSHRTPRNHPKVVLTGIVSFFDVFCNVFTFGSLGFLVQMAVLDRFGVGSID